MRKKILPLLITAVSLVSRANDIEPTKEFYTATRVATNNPVIFDGILAGDWTGVPVLADPGFYVRNGCEGINTCSKFSGGTNATLVLFERYQGGDWTGPDDHTSAVQIVYDADYVYFGFVVTDEYHENFANSAWNGDSIQLMIANSNRTVEVALYNYALGGTENNLGSTIVEHERPVPPPGVTEAIVTRDIVAKKTTYEIRLPKAAVGLTDLVPGATFGLGMAINDGDELTPGQKGWGGLGAHAIVFGKHPLETALITLGTNFPTVDRIFYSAINPTIDFFAFRANDKGASIVDPATARLTIDAQIFTPVASPRVGDAIDFTYTPSRPFVPGNHTYIITVRDTAGNPVTVSNIFVTPQYAFLTAADDLSAPTDGGFMWSIHQNDLFTNGTISRALHQLAGLLGDNFADGSAMGPTFVPSVPGPTPSHPITFELEETVNLDQSAGASGDITPDQQMPGIPGFNVSGQTDGIAAEITTFLDLPVGRHTLIVNSEDGFRTTAGNINDIFRAQIAGEFVGTRSPAADTAYTVRVQDAGVYAFRTVYYAGALGASIEWKMQKGDGSEVLLNDLVNGGFPAYRRASSLPTGINMVSPLPAVTGVALDTPIFASILEGTNTVTLSSVQLVFNGALVTPTVTRFNNLIEVRYQPPSSLQPLRQYTSILRYTAGGVLRNQSWNFVTLPSFSVTIQRSAGQINVSWTEPGVVLQESTDLATWTDLTGATSPHSVIAGGPNTLFYRLRK